MTCEHLLATCNCEPRYDICQGCGEALTGYRLPRVAGGWFLDTCSWKCARNLALGDEDELLDRCVQLEGEGHPKDSLRSANGIISVA